MEEGNIEEKEENHEKRKENHEEEVEKNPNVEKDANLDVEKDKYIINLYLLYMSLKRMQSAPALSDSYKPEAYTEMMNKKDEDDDDEFHTARSIKREPVMYKRRGPTQPLTFASTMKDTGRMYKTLFSALGQFIPRRRGGTRKKRKRGRKNKTRNKRGKGKPAMAGESVCVWYGEGNKPSAVDKCSIEQMRPDDPLNGKIHPIAYKVKTSWGIPVGVDLWAISEKTVKKKHSIFNNAKPVDSKTQTGNYHIYYILYEEKCGHGGERFELMKLNNVNIINDNGILKIPGNKKGYSKWNDPMSIKENGKNLQFNWGKQNPVLPVGSMFAIQARRHSIGGSKKTRKRRRKTRKKKRKKRKKSKKRRK